MATKLVQLSSHLEGLEREICSKSLTPRQYTLLHKKLDRILKSVQSSNSNTEDLRNKIAELYGQLEDHFAKTKLQKIQKTAARLAELIHKYNGEHRPLAKDRNTLSRLSEASALLSQTETDPMMTDPEDVYALLNLAKAVHEGNTPLMKELYACLPACLKAELDRHMNKLNARPFTDALATTQALMALCQELLGHKEHYATKAEIDNFFGEMTALTPKGPSKVVSFASYLK